jgi:hypothetical protein
MTLREDVAKAMAFFESTDDIGLLHELVAEIAPRARRLVGQHLARGTEETIPSPADLRPAREPASASQAVKTLRTTNDFALLQALARTIGRRIEAIEIVASAEFPEGTRVRVPVTPNYPRSNSKIEGTVETTGTVLRVLLINGETWEGPPSLAELAAQA